MAFLESDKVFLDVKVQTLGKVKSLNFDNLCIATCSALFCYISTLSTSGGVYPLKGTQLYVIKSIKSLSLFLPLILIRLD